MQAVSLLWLPAVVEATYLSVRWKGLDLARRVICWPMLVLKRPQAVFEVLVSAATCLALAVVGSGPW